MPDIFLSYSRDDQIIARRFADALAREGFSIWWDATLNAGEAYDQVTEKALKTAKAVVVLWSKRSVDSRWVRAEATQADRLKTLVPVMIEPCERPIMFELTHTADLSHWSGDPNEPAWQSFLSGLRRFVDQGESVRAAPLAVPGASRAPRFSATSLGVLAAVVIIAAGIVWAVTRTSGKTPAQATPTATAGGSPSPAKAINLPAGVSLAALPFVNLSGDAQQEYFSDGLTEEILNQLAQIKALRLTARTSSFSFKGKNEDVRVIGEKLGVNNLLEGSVRKDGKQLRITAELINAADGTDVWSRTYDRELSGVFAVQEEIAKDVSQALSITLDVGEMSRAKGGTTNLEAYDQYLRGRALRRQQGGSKDILQATQFYREAVALDAKFVQGWSELYAELSDQLIYVPENAAVARTQMDEVRARLVALAPDDWRTKAIRVDQFMAEHRWSEAEIAATSANESAPIAAGISGNFYTIFLLDVGRINDAAPLVERDLQADPLSLLSSYAQQIVCFLTGRPEEAQAEYARSKTIAGNHANVDAFALLRALARKDTKPAELKALDRLVIQDGINGGFTRMPADKIDNGEAALAWIRQAFNDPTNQTAYGTRSLASLADHFGDRDLALAALRRSYIDLRGTNIGMLWQPFATGLRADPRFNDILRDLGLAQYFRASGKWGDFCQPVGKDDFECH